ncbi:MAG: NAD/NADP octopine/nopaline dehydrogenase family protein [Candidatus Aminicenantes bacterium]|nr:NAD/NADP octopine/nopaline dehydrogenase family protein [Candidatus Aminicenantes bacterium]
MTILTSCLEGKKPNFCVLGAGHGGMAMAAHLSLLGFTVNLFNRTEARIVPVQQREGISLSGEIEGFGHVRIATSDIAEALEDSDILMVVVPAVGHRYMAEVCAPHLRDGHVVVLNPGRTLGALEFKQVLKEKGCRADVVIGETQSLLYASRAIGPGEVRIFRIKNSVPLATIPAHRIPEVLKVVRQAIPQFVPGTNIFKTSFDNIGAVFHPAITILNASWIEERVDFEFYMQGISASVCLIMEKMDEERVAVAEALGIHALTAREWLYRAYHATGKNLYDAMMDNPGYRDIMAPKTLKVRYITEDVPMSLVPMASLGRMLGVPTPTMDTFIHLASVIHNCDYMTEGRTVERLGIDGMSIKDLRLLALGEETSP